MMRRFTRNLLVLLVALGTGTALAAPAGLDLDTVFAPQPPWGLQPSRIVWAPDGSSFLYTLPTQDPFATLKVYQYDVASESARVLIDPAKYGKKARTPGELVWSPDSKDLTFSEGGTLYVRDLATGLDRTVAKGAGDPQWSPKNDAIAYVHDADLFVAFLAPKLSIKRLTTGGKRNDILNGGLDWVYPEELGTEHGFAWSPDGSEIAYMRMDERPVTSFPIVDFIPYDNTVHYERYPLAGEKNPLVTLHVVQVSDGTQREVYDAGARDEYLPFFGWKPNSHQLVAELLDRAQKHLRVVAWDGGAAAPRTLYAQSDPKWMDDIPLPRWLPDGRSVWTLDREGTAGIYLRSASGRLTRLTGLYHTMRLEGVDAKSQTAYLAAAYPTRRDSALLAISLRGGAPEDLTPGDGSHRTSLSPVFNAFVDTSSALNEPPEVRLVDVNGDVKATIAPRDAQLASELLPTQMLEVDSGYGKLDAIMLKPPNFDPGKRYPVIVYVYGGPAAPTTTDSFGYQTGLYHQLLARHGFIVFSIDGPASQIDSDANVRLLYHNFGPGSFLGQKLGVAYLKTLPYVDRKRIGIWGWSFGGYETIYALTHSDLFKAGAAVAPVTDWHLYDTIYTERYMGTPQDQPAAYDASSDLLAAGRLHGDLLISHGTSDDNVHMANSISLLQRFIDAGKTNVDFYVYPRRVHSIAGVPQRRHLFEHMLEWWERHL